MYLLLVAFVVLKLCGVIAWSWWWVTAPLWAALAIPIGVVMFALTVMLCIEAAEDKRRSRRVRR